MNLFKIVLKWLLIQLRNKKWLLKILNLASNNLLNLQANICSTLKITMELIHKMMQLKMKTNRCKLKRKKKRILIGNLSNCTDHY